MPSTLVKVTVQSCLIAATSNIMAQALQAHKDATPFKIDWRPVIHFILFTCVVAPINFLWAETMEHRFPSTRLVPTEAGLRAAAAARGQANELEREKQGGGEQSSGKAERTTRGGGSPEPLTRPQRSLRNALIKVVQEQTLSAGFNVFAFTLFSAGVIRGRGGAEALRVARRDWSPLMLDGWKMWPAVSLVNMLFVTDLQLRTLIGSLAGLVWNIYLSMYSGS